MKKFKEINFNKEKKIERFCQKKESDKKKKGKCMYAGVGGGLGGGEGEVMGLVEEKQINC